MASYQGVLTMAMTAVLLALPSLTHGVTLHVRPTSANTSCPTHPCYTLFEYAQHLGQYLNESKLTFQFLPGKHALNVSLTVTHIHRLDLLGKTGTVRAVCSSSVGFAFWNISEVRLEGLAFVACDKSHLIRYAFATNYYAVLLQSIQTAEIINCTFKDSYGCALGVVDSHVIVKGSNSFLNNCRLCSNEGCHTVGSTYYGGGVFADGSNLSFTGSINFISNSALLGGGIYAQSNSNVNISGNTTFIDNSVYYNGGGVHVQGRSNVNISGHTTFTGNKASGNGGGVCSWSNGNISISGKTTFTDNSAGGDGRGIYAASDSNIIITGNTTFVDTVPNSNLNISGYFPIIDYSTSDGGGIHAGPNSNITISGNTTFINIFVSGNGGGVYVGSTSSVTINGNTTFINSSDRYISGTFLGNSASGNGGGIYVGSNSSVIISGNTTFIGYSASGDGGGVYVGYNSSVTFNGGNITFTGTLANNGGGVYVGSNSNVILNGGNITFIGTSANNGGGVYVGSSSNVNISGNTNFIGSSAGDGGGIFADSNSNVNIGGNTAFTDNSANGNGGGLSAGYNSKLNISANTTFSGNSASNGGGMYLNSISTVVISGSSTFVGNSARDGGGVYGGSVIINGNTTFSGNSAFHGGGALFVERFLSLEGNSSFKNCSATIGGVIYAKRIQFILSGTNVFYANRAENFGGGFYVHKSSLNLLGDNTFTANQAGSRGGGIYAQETKVSFSGTGLLSGNVAKLDGGGIYADGSHLTLSGNITIRNNSAQLGGGFYSDNNTFTINGDIVVERNVAKYYGGGIYTRRCPLIVTGNNVFIANSAGEGGGIYATANTTLELNGVNTFIGNSAHISGGGIWLDNSNLTLSGSNHFLECAASYEGGAIFTYAAKASLSGNNTFETNSATTGGGIHVRWSNVSVTNSSKFKYNIAVFGGGIYTDNSTFNFNRFSTFFSNQAKHTGGGIYAARSVVSFLGTNCITANKAARDGGGIYTRDDSVINLLGLNNYQNNSAGDTGGGISAFQSSFKLDGKNSFDGNNAVKGGGFYTFKSTVRVHGKSLFINNCAGFNGGGFAVIHSTLLLNGSTDFMRNLASTGGGIYIDYCRVYTDGNNCFKNNTAKSGGGIDARNSVVEFHGHDVFMANIAINKGAAIHVSFTDLIFRGSNYVVNNSARYGGGIYSESSNLTLVHHVSGHHERKLSSCINCKSVCNKPLTIPESKFVNNHALRGGAQYFDISSNLSMYQTVHAHFLENHATEFGGAIYVVDAPGASQFLSQQPIPFRSQCFFHILGKEQSLDLSTSPFKFVNNSAGIRGSVLYGGLLEKCNLRYNSALELFNVSILHNKNYSISSDPTQICLCSTSKLSCREVSRSISIYPGQQVVVSVVAIDQSGSAIPTLIHANIHSGHNLTMSEIISYETGSNCTSRNYSITPRSHANQLELYPSNRSGDTIHLLLDIKFESCPIGFERSNFTGECICDHRLWQYTNSCIIDRQTIVRNASRTFWIGVSYNNKTFEGFIHHRYCPLNYCTKEGKHINLNSPDEQCSFNHSGLLCGKCKEGLSILLGSSQCKECSNNYLALLVPFAVAGVLLVILLFLLHLTVAAGTLHGLIFYANIVAANHHIFFPHSSNNPASIFIAWLNLDLGVQTCFYNGLDAYAKVWLEFVFPVYIWVIVGLLVYISHHSVTATKLLGSSPVPVLATLFLLSYAKVLRTIISALSLTILHYPDKDVVVWNHDANVPLANYIPLGLVALLFLLFIFLPYTLLLLLGQWLQPKSHLCFLSWVRNHKVKAVLDIYHAPYKPKHRFWTGLMLLLRCALFLAIAFGFSGDVNFNLLVISSVVFGIVVGFALLGGVYKSWYLNALELSFILNLGIFAVATNYVLQSGGSQAGVAYTSVGIAFLTFLGIVIYHIYMRIKSKMQYIQRGKELHYGNKSHINNGNNGNPGSQCHQPRAIPTVTRTEVNLRELRSPLDLLSYRQMQ